MLRRPDRFLLLGGLMIAIHLGVRGWALSGSWFYFDDLAFMSRAMNQSFDASYLFESYGGHLMPAGFALTRVLTDSSAYDWLPWAMTLLILQALAAAGIFRLLVSMFGRRPLVLALLAGYLFYVFTLSAGIWWAAGINQLPLLISLGFGLHAFLAHLRTRRMRPLAAALAWTVAGLLFYEKTLLLVGVYAIVALAYFTAGDTPSRLRELWSSYRAAVVSFGVLSVGYLALYTTYGLDFSPTEASGQSWGPLAWNLVMIAFATAVVGGPLEWQSITVGSLADPSTILQLVSWVAVAGLVYHARRTRTLSGRAWLPLVFTMVCNVLLLASARAIVVGPDIAREFRYQTEAGALAVICVGLALMPLRGARETNDERPDASVRYERPAVLTLVTAVVVALATVSTVRYVEGWQGNNPSEAYFDNVAAGLRDAGRAVPLIDTGIPQTLLWSYRYPENAYSHVFRGLDAGSGRATYPKTSLDNLYMFDDAGRLSPVAIPPTRAMVPGDACGYRLSWERVTQVPLDGPVIGGGWWIQLSYASPRSVPVEIEAGDSSYRVELPEGLHNLYFEVEGEFSEVRLRDDGPDRRHRDSGLCVTALSLGLPTPVSSSS